MNLLCTSSGATLLTSQSLFKGALSVIRPLYYLDKKLIRACLRQAGLLPVRNHCPHSRDSTRLQLRRLLAHFEKRHPRAATNIFWGIHNLKPDYLPRRARAGRRPA
ncbi:hypothetical protein FJY71_09450 [candidate division WOR-3 bacterium]|nr:hypothetical protein [candidate division WOR-3 bacterium]